MGFLDLIDSMKGKALDLTNIELIKHTFQLQEQNNDQLRSLNDAYRDTLRLKDNEIERLQNELQKALSAIEDLRASNHQLAESAQSSHCEQERYPDFDKITLTAEEKRVLGSQIDPDTYGHHFFKIATISGLSKAKATYCAERLATLGLVYVKGGQMALTPRGREFMVAQKMM